MSVMHNGEHTVKNGHLKLAEPTTKPENLSSDGELYSVPTDTVTVT